MTDVHDKVTRSYNMSKIRGRDTKPELIARKYLFKKGFRYRVNFKKLPGSPDIVLKKYNTVIFIQGCFWHGHINCKYFKLPSTRKEFWKKKISDNKLRDKRNYEILEEKGWYVIEIWECELKKDKRESVLSNLVELILSNRNKFN